MPVPDVAQAASFYRTLLGIDGEPVAGGSRHYFHCGATILALANPGEHGNEWRANAEHVYLAVHDLEEAPRRARDAAARDLGEIETQPWGERSFYCKDAFGNPLCFVDAKTKFTGEG